MNNVTAVLKEDANFTTYLKTDDHQLIADEPVELGGDNRGPNPYALVSSGLAACTLITMKMYAKRKGWELGEISVEVSHNKDYHAECEDCEKSSQKKDIFERRIHISGNLDETQLKRMLYIADRCPVHRTLEGSAVVKTELME
ncbi:MAG: hypothetical protein CL840_11960 [Crocinitomicaceae bacterium]|nr:hypothetical protein [Crocinitomicaceae bacterium]|tara:strand:- start:15121 stop:15549 length:429 start_codon:yes stop_codon:yes gene_type:complete